MKEKPLFQQAREALQKNGSIEICDTLQINKKVRGRQIHVEIPAAEYDAFKALANGQDLSMQQLARRCIRAYMEYSDAYKDTHLNLRLVPEKASSVNADIARAGDQQ